MPNLTHLRNKFAVVGINFLSYWIKSHGAFCFEGYSLVLKNRKIIGDFGKQKQLVDLNEKRALMGSRWFSLQ